jgi:eukaryotic-like serine/threonine-protein kinase
MAGNAAHFPQKLGPYELVRPIATGGMAEVYLARRDGPHGFTKTVALKRILPQLARDQDFVAMFIDEARVCAQLSHPNLVQVFDFGEAAGELYMAMEFVDGTNCAKAVRKAAAMAETVPLEAALHVVLSVLRGLEYAHAAVDLNGVPLGLVHRDVSPGNILMARSGAVKLSDFGIARADDFEQRTEEGQLKGKLGYMSPEQVTGRQVDARSDLFTLGIVLAELLIARPLFGTGNELDVLMRIRDADLTVFERYCSHLTEDMRTIVRTALAQDPDERYACAADFADAIEEFTRHNQIHTGAPRLVAWLTHAGLVKIPVSGEHALALNVSPRPRRAHTPRGILRASSASEHVRPSVPTLADKLEPPPSGPLSPADYRVASGDKTWGPVSYARLVELFATGKASADSLVARASGPFRPARELPELARLLLSPALSSTDAPDDQRLRWTLDRATHVHKLLDLVSHKRTGLLVASQDARKKQFFLVDGAFTFATSTDKAELLGQQLIARGQALPMEIDMALALCPRYGGRLGDALVGLGVLRPVELFRALVAQTHDRIVDLVSWRNGSLEFILGARADDETILHGVAPIETIARGVIEGYDEPELVAVLAPFMQGEVRKAPPGEISNTSLRLKRRHASVLSAIREPWVLEDLVAHVQDDLLGSRDDVLRAVFIGLSAGLLVTTGWPPSEQKPSVPTRRMY